MLASTKLENVKEYPSEPYLTAEKVPIAEATGLAKYVLSLLRDRYSPACFPSA